MGYLYILQRVLRVLGAIFSAIGIPLVITIVIGLLVWFGGPFLVISGDKPLASVRVRIIVVVTLIVIWLIYILVSFLIKRKGKSKGKDNNKNNEKIVQGMIEAEKESSKNLDESVRKEMETLQQRMIDAHKILRESKLNPNKNIYELPWYIFIGPSGTGKTTAINHSGLKYPLQEKMGVSMIKGVGGTRNCDWWFTDKAILIDTAGRYVTQDSNEKRDGHAWIGFLELLKKWRPLRPINGVIISMALSDLLKGTKKETILHGRAIKNRLQELQNQLGMTFPVYVLISKCDLIAGFKEFFSDLKNDECEQVWGVTFSQSNDYDSIVEGFNEEFHKLINNINARLNSRLLSERSQDAKRVIYEFPKQLRLLQSKLDGFLKEIFSANAYEVEPMLRGVYLTSATQKGQPIDQLSSAMLTNPRTQVLYDTQKPVRSYFIKKVLEDVIFPEQNLATTNKYYDKKDSILRTLTFTGLILILFGFSAAWWNSSKWNKQIINKTKQSITLYRTKTQDGLKNKDNLIQLSKTLTILRDMPIGYKNNPSQNKLLRWGLYQANDLKSISASAYTEALQDYLQPELNSILIRELKRNKHDLSYLYGTLRVYLMLYQPKNFVRKDVITWFNDYFAKRIGGVNGLNDKIREDLIDHTKTLLSIGLLPAVIDTAQVKIARRNLSNLTMSDRAYQYLKFKFLSSDIPDFKITDILSADSLKAFGFLDRKGPNDFIPGLYTYDGFYNIFLKNEDKIIANVIKDGWVYGGEIKPFSEATKKRVLAEFDKSYFRDYIFYWNNFINNITLNDFTSNNIAMQNIDLLSNSEAPMQSIISAVQKNVNLTKKPKEASKAKDKILDKINKNKKLAAKTKKIENLLTDAQSGPLPGHQVNQYFAQLLKFNIKRLDFITKTLLVLNKQLKQQALAQQVPYDIDPATGRRFKKDPPIPINYLKLRYTLARQTRRMPEPVFGWISTIINWISYKDVRVNKAAESKFKNTLEDKWKYQVIRECNATIKGRYPFAKSRYEVKLRNFTHFFGYGGTLDRFFNKNLVNFVDTSKPRWTSMNGMVINPAVLAMLQRADLIRKSYFQEGQRKPQVEFLMRPLYLDGDINYFQFNMNGQSFTYRHDPIRNIKLLWPGARKPNSTIYSFGPITGTNPTTKAYYGDWAFFHFLDDVEKNSPKVKQNGILNIVLKGEVAKYYLIPISADNPFWNQSIRTFTCPFNI